MILIVKVKKKGSPIGGPFLFSIASILIRL